MIIGDIIARIKADTSDFKKGANEAVQGAKKISSSIDKASIASVASLGAIGYAVKKTADAIWDLSREGARFQSVQESFGEMTRGMGIDGDKLISDTKKAVKDTISEFDVMQNYMKANTLMGKEALGDNSKNFIKFAEVAKKASRATGQDVNYMFESIINGIGRQQPLWLDNTGIVVDATQVYKDYADTLGISSDALTVEQKKVALTNAYLEKANRLYKDVQVTAGGTNSDFMRLDVTLEELKLRVGLFLTEALQPLVKWFNDLAVLMRDQVLPFLEKHKEIIVGLAVAVGTTLLGIIGGLIAAMAPLIVATLSIVAPFVFVGAIIGAVASALYLAWTTNFAGIRDFTQSALNLITGFFQKHKADFEYIWNGIKEFIQAFVGWAVAFWTKYGDDITKILGIAWGLVKTITSGALDAIISTIKLFVALFKGDWENVWDAVKNINSAGWNIVKGVFGTFATVADTALRALWGTFTDWFTKIWNKAREFATNIRREISDAFNVKKKNSPSILDRLNEIRSTATDILNDITIPSFNHNIAQTLSVPVNGIPSVTKNNSVVQNVNVYPADMLDLDTISDRLAYKFRMSL